MAARWRAADFPLAYITFAVMAMLEALTLENAVYTRDKAPLIREATTLSPVLTSGVWCSRQLTCILPPWRQTILTRIFHKLPRISRRTLSL